MTITRSRVLLRARYGWPRRTVIFNNGALQGNYRAGAAGFVSMCWSIPARPPLGGPNIVSLLTDGWCQEIQHNQLKPGDAIGYLGADAVDSDGGVIVIFDSWLENDPRHGVALTWEHLPITSPGPDQRARPVDFRWHAYRFKDIVDD